ncbi:MAG: DsrE family protein [Anaerolineae bacterium]|nr:DsrE family protein [Anaerolineae bacterium]
MERVEQDDLLVVWTSGDRDVALKMVFMYTGNAKRHGWWEGVTLLVWGPSQKLLTEDEELQAKLAEMLSLGVRVVACKACADIYPVTDKLEDLGVEVFYTGQFLTDWIRSAGSVITF